jgi:hypothetical protein
MQLEDYQTVTEKEADDRGYTHLTMPYRNIETHLLDKAIKSLAQGTDYLLVRHEKPPGIEIWRKTREMRFGD